MPKVFGQLSPYLFFLYKKFYQIVNLRLKLAVTALPVEKSASDSTCNQQNNFIWIAYSWCQLENWNDNVQVFSITVEGSLSSTRVDLQIC